MTLYGEDARTEVVAMAHGSRHHPDHQAALRPPEATRRIGYARVHSTDQQALREAVEALLAAGVTAEHIHTDRGTRGPAAQRPGWHDTVADIRDGDVLVVPSPACLARSQAELHRLMSELSTRAVHVELTAARGSGAAATPELLKQMRDDLLAEITAERDYWQAQYDGRRGRPHRLIDPEHELATIEGFDSGAHRDQLAFQMGISRAQLYRIAAAGPV